MAKFLVDKFAPGFFDVAQDVSRNLPVEIIERWTRSAQSLDAARQLLDPNRLEGIVVSSDSAGLTRILAATCKNRSGAGLPRGTSLAEKR